MQATLSTEFKSTQGYKEAVRSFYDKGGLDYLIQRMDIGTIEGDNEKPHRFKLKVGKTKDKEFISNKNKDGSTENPQEFRTAFPDIVREIMKEVLRAEIKLRKLRGEYSPDQQRFLINQRLSDIIDVFREKQ